MLLLALGCSTPPVEPLPDPPRGSDAIVFTWYADGDGDGWGAGEPVHALDAPAGHVASEGDCDDADAGVHPGVAADGCDGVDADCDGSIDEDGDEAVYADMDGDDWGDASATTTGCPGQEGVAAAGDCDDADPAAHPGAPEVADGLDQDCDGVTDEGTIAFDDDGDGESEDAGDCDDADPTRASTFPERCGDLVDEDCDGEARACGLSGDRDLGSADALLVGSGGVGSAIAGEDLDGDGAGDIVATAYQASEGAAAGGAVYTVAGPVYGRLDLAGSEPRVEGAAYRDNAGRGLLAGDLDGDGVPDLLVAGGSDLEELRLFRGPISGAVAFDGPEARIAWDGDPGSFAGGALGDADADGVSDLLVGYREGDGTVLSMIRGPVTADADVADAAWSVTDADHGMTLAMGDLDGDGVDDLAVGMADYPLMPWAGSWTSAEWPGVAYVVLGPLDGTSGVLADADAILYASDHDDELGGGIAAGSDLDGDGEPEVVVSGLRGGADDGGAVWVVPWSGGVTAQVADVATAELVGEPDSAAGAFAADGDLDGDGQADLVAGVPEDGADGFVGVVYGPLSGSLDLASADARILGAWYGRFGYGVSTVPDMDGDGADEVLVTDPDNRGDYPGGVVGLFYGGAR